MMKTSTDGTEFSSQPEPERPVDRPATAEAAQYIPGAAWITDEMVAYTIKVWAPYYDGKLTPEEAVEILVNVKNFARALLMDDE